MNKLCCKLSIGYQIGAVGAVGVVGLIFVGLLYLFGSMALSASNRELEKVNATLERLAAVKLDLLEARRGEKDFLLRKKDEYAEKQRAAVASFNVDMKGLKELLPSDEQGRIDKFTSLVSDYVRQFSRVVDIAHKVGLDESSGLQGAMYTSLRDVEKAVEERHEVALEAALLQLRQFEKNFLIRHDVKELERMRGAFNRFNVSLQQSSMAGEAARVTERMMVYQRAFGELATAI